MDSRPRTTPGDPVPAGFNKEAVYYFDDRVDAVCHYVPARSGREAEEL